MDALNYNQAKRTEALSWWNGLDMKQKIRMGTKHYPTKNLFTLTGREIEEIFKKETICTPEN